MVLLERTRDIQVPTLPRGNGLFIDVHILPSSILPGGIFAFTAQLDCLVENRLELRDGRHAHVLFHCGVDGIRRDAGRKESDSERRELRVMSDSDGEEMVVTKLVVEDEYDEGSWQIKVSRG